MAEPSGQNPLPLRQQFAIGIDVGGTKCAGGLISLPDGKVLSRRLQPTQPQRGGEAVLADVIAMIRSLQDEASRDRIHVAAVGIGVAELVDKSGQIFSDATIRWKNVAIGERITAETRLSAFVDADVRAAARAEAHLGAGRGFRSFIYVTIGTGISASLVIDGKPYPGARGLTGTFASSPGLIPGADGALVAGLPLEHYASGPALAARMAAAQLDFTGDARDVLALAESGNITARAVVLSAGLALGASIAQLVNALDPEAVVLGGGLGLATGHYRSSLDASMRAHVWSEHHREIPLRSAELGADAGIVGAAIGAVAPPEC